MSYCEVVERGLNCTCEEADGLCVCVLCVPTWLPLVGVVFCIQPSVIADRISRSKHKICVLLELLSKISVLLE